LHKVKQLLTLTKLISSVSEPVLIAKQRHQNPIMGIVMKKDTLGKDEQVLNLPIKTEAVKSTNKKNYWNKTQIAMIFLAITVASALLFIFFAQTIAK
jgi:hypothetical protein